MNEKIIVVHNVKRFDGFHKADIEYIHLSNVAYIDVNKTETFDGGKTYVYSVRIYFSGGTDCLLIGNEAKSFLELYKKAGKEIKDD